MIRAFLLVLGFIGLLFSAIFVVKAKQLTGQPMMAFPPTVITSAEATAQSWQRSVKASGSLAASQGVRVSAEVAGTIREIHFESGQQVEKGALLITLDDTVEQAQLKAAEASANLADINLRRSQDLLSSRTISQSEFDSAEASASSAKAQLEQIKATIAKKRIHAPFSGTLGIRLVDVGEYLSPGTPIASLQQLDPIYVDFSLPQKQLQAAQAGYEVALGIDAFGEESFTGKIEAINPDLDLATRTFRVRAVLENPDHQLRPGMFANVGVVQPEPLQVVAIPVTAVYPQAYGNSIFVIKPAPDGSGGKVVEQRFITLGISRGDYVQVVEGLEAGEEVATAGVFKLNDGAPVAVDNSKAIELSLQPTPKNA